MKNTAFKIAGGVLLLVSCLGSVSFAQNLADPQPEDLQFERARKARHTRNLVLRNCPLVEGANRVLVLPGGKKLALPRALNRGEYRLGRGFRFFACADPDEDGNYSIYAKRRHNLWIFEYAPQLEDFPEGQSSAACNEVRSWPSNLIYKTVGSGHFYDCRRNTAGLIAKHGYSGPCPSIINIIDTQGNNVGSLGLYDCNPRALYGARWYACHRHTPPYGGEKIATLARRNTGSPDVYFNFGHFCYGPVPANKCIGSKQC